MRLYLVWDAEGISERVDTTMEEIFSSVDADDSDSDSASKKRGRKKSKGREEKKKRKKDDNSSEDVSAVSVSSESASEAVPGSPPLQILTEARKLCAPFTVMCVFVETSMALFPCYQIYFVTS